MKKSLVLISLCIIVISFSYKIIPCETVSTDKEKERTSAISKLIEYDVDIFDVLLNTAAQGVTYNDKDALRLCPSIIYKLRYGNASDWTNELYAPIDFLMSQFYEHGYLPRAPYDGLENYVTSMDAPLLAVTARLADERSGDERFQKYMLDLIPYIVSDTSKNGFVLKISDSEWWPLEYA